MKGHSVTRRNFMVRAIFGIGAFIGAAVAVPLAGFGIFPAIKKREAGWSNAGSAAELRTNMPEERRFLETVKTGWQEVKKERTAWLIRREDGTITAFAPNCPHLGCGYRWIESELRFKCPCHASVFDIEGKVLSGPAPRPLDRLDTKVEDGKVMVRFEIFQVGTARKVVA